MRLVTYGEKSEERLAVVASDERYIIDLNIASHGSIPADPVPFFSGDYWDLARRILTLPPSEISNALIERSAVRIGAPIPKPPTLIALGLNYRDHAEEGNQPLPQHPLLFAKAPASVIGPYDPIPYPPQVQQLDYEVELAVVIGKKARRIGEETAPSVVAGYTVLNDVSARDIQFRESQWFRAKSFDGFAPMGPAIVTPDELPDPDNVRLWCAVNGQILQNSNTNQMVFNVYQIIAFISECFTLFPGDVITTGTPAGVGVFRKPPVLLKPGDIVETGVEGIGVLRNQVVALA